MFTRYICFCVEKKITPEQIDKVKKERLRMLRPFYRPIIYNNY